jgi:hypothetical protein
MVARQEHFRKFFADSVSERGNLVDSPRRRIFLKSLRSGDGCLVRGVAGTAEGSTNFFSKVAKSGLFLIASQ